MPDQMTHLDLKILIRAGLCGVVSGAGRILIQKAGLLGAYLEFGDF
jgi:hypothetical protein